MVRTMIDILNLFIDNSVKHWLKGKNCTEGWVNVQCPLPRCGDSSNHLGINLSSGGYHCWHCGSSGTIYDILPTILGCNQRQANKIIHEYETEYETHRKKQPRRSSAFRDIIPHESTDTLPDMHRRYLISRRFSPELIKLKYKIRACNILGKFKFRIIIPVIQNGVIVQFTGLGVADQEPHYKHCPNELALADMKSCLYNIDTVKDTALIVEGALDAWRIGDGAVATFGTTFTDAQVNILAKRVDRAFVLFDSVAKDPRAPAMAEKLANQLSAHIPQVEVLYLEEGDPCDMTDTEVQSLRKEIELC